MATIGSVTKREDGRVAEERHLDDIGAKRTFLDLRH